MKFIDLFAGLGGFHVALRKFDFECVFACEIDETLSNLYNINFKTPVCGDIKKVSENDIPSHDILCAGFPCQPFSKAGQQKGMQDFSRGSLFDDIARIIKKHKPKYFLLENVPNLQFHNNGNTWKYITKTLVNKLGYELDFAILSPHQFGIPQIRERLFIVGCRNGLNRFKWPSKQSKELNIRSILDINPVESRKLPKRVIQCINVWQQFINSIPKYEKLPSFPIWSTEYCATYPYKQKAPYRCTSRELDKYCGMFGTSLSGLSKKEKLELLPKYSQQKVNKFPTWKQKFISQNRDFLARFKDRVKHLIPEIMTMPFSWQKFEWNCQGEERNLKNFIIQFRASGLRVKRPNFSPSLVASTTTQIPIIGWEERYMTVKEASRLQSLEEIEMPKTEATAFRALGNAVNAKIVYLIAKNLIKNV